MRYTDLAAHEHLRREGAVFRGLGSNQSVEADVSGADECAAKMDNADPELAAGDEPFYYRVR